MAVPLCRQSALPVGFTCRYVFVLLVLLLLLSCSNNGDDIDDLAAPPPVTPTLEQQTINGLLDLYQTALRQEDIDRLQELLLTEGNSAPSSLTRQTAQEREIETFDTTNAFRQAITTTFQTQHLIDLQILNPDIRLTPDPPSVSFLEMLSVEDPMTLEQRTLAVRTTFQLARRQSGDTVTFLIAAVTREGPRLQVTTPGQVIAGALTRVTVTETTNGCPLTAVEIEVPETEEKLALTAADGFLHGVFTAPTLTEPQPLRVTVHGMGADGTPCEEVVLHRYRTRQPGQGVIQPIVGAGSTPFFAVEEAADGSLWFGGEAGLPGAIGTLVQVAADGSILRIEQPINEQFAEAPRSRIADIARDQSGRLHVLFVARAATGGVVGNGVVVLDPEQPDLFCQTVNVLDPAYPFRVLDAATGTTRPSPSTRAIAAGDGDIWLFGSDGGVARVTDTFSAGDCPQGNAAVTYNPVFRREESALLSNTVPALVVGTDATLWFGTALGVSRLQAGQFTSLPFDPALTLRGDVATLEAFFQAVAEAIFEARPLTSVALGNVSFTDAFGVEVVKEDLNFSAVEDRQGRLWFGTLGGGIRRLEGDAQTLHLTRQDGLSSNIIFALAVAPDGAIWAATDEGVSRVDEQDGNVTITNFTTLDGLALPVVRDVVVDAQGTAWLATARGLFRIIPQGGRVQGIVRDASGHPVAGADVLVFGTPFRVVTDTDGNFVLHNLPPGIQVIQVDGSLAVADPFPLVIREVEVTVGEQTVVDVGMLPQEETRTLRLVRRSGNGQVGVVGMPLPFPLVVEVEDTLTNPIPDIPVTFSITEGTGVPVRVIVPSDINGQAVANVMVAAVGTIRVEATVDGMESVVFSATGRAEGRDVRLVAVSGNNQIAAVGQELPEPLVVRLEDQFGNPIMGEIVTAEIIQGEGVLLSELSGEDTTDLMAETDEQGEARFFLRAGSRPDEIITRVSAFDQEVQFVTIVGFASPQGIAVEAAGTLVLVDIGLEAVIRVDPNTGSRTLVSGRGRGRGPLIGFPEDIAVEATGDLVLVDRLLNTVVRVDPNTGNRTLVSGRDTLSGTVIGNGRSLAQPVGITLDAMGTLVVLDRSPAVVRVDPATGDRIIVTGDAIGIGVSLIFPVDIAVEPEGTLVVTDLNRQAVLRVNPDTGNRTIVSDRETGSGPPFVDIGTVDVERDGYLVVTDNVLGIVQVDPETGNRTILSDSMTGSGPPFFDPVNIAVEVDGNLGGKLVVTDNVLGVVLVDSETGDRSVIIPPPSITAPPFFPADIGVDGNGNLFVADIGLQAVLRVDPDTGDRTIVSGSGIGEGPPLALPVGIFVDIDGILLVANGASANILQVDSSTGDRDVVSGPSRGSGPMLEGHRGVAVERNGDLVVADGSARSVVRVNRENGDRTIVSGDSTEIGSGVPFIFPQSIGVDTDNTLLVVDAFAGAIVRVDSESGDRAIVSGHDRGRGLPLQYPQDLAFESNGSVVVVDDFLDAVIRVDLATGDRTVVSGGPDNIGNGPAFERLTSIEVGIDGTFVVGDLFRETVLRVDPDTGDRTIISIVSR